MFSLRRAGRLLHLLEVLRAAEVRVNLTSCRAQVLLLERVLLRRVVLEVLRLLLLSLPSML
jgi:hypothetical protein